MTSNLRNRKPTTRQTPDLMLVMETMRRFRSDMKPSEVAKFSGLSRERTDAALADAEDKGLIRSGYWRVTARGKR